jgi:hypothetical protein
VRSPLHRKKVGQNRTRKSVLFEQFSMHKDVIGAQFYLNRPAFRRRPAPDAQASDAAATISRLRKHHPDDGRTVDARIQDQNDVG